MSGPPTLAETTVGVIGSGTESHDDVATDVGILLASLGVNLLTGGGRGVMTSVSRAFTGAPRRQGICIGILPSASREERATPKPGYPNPFVELAIYTHLPLSGDRGRDEGSRNHINVLSCDCLIALPGGDGTVSEVSLALDYGKRVLAYARDAVALRVFPAEVPRTSELAGVEAFVRTLLR